MAVSAVKAASGLGVAAATVGGGIFVAKGMEGSPSTPKSTVQDKLKQNGYSPLDLEKSDGWSEVLGAYNQHKNNLSIRFDHGDREISEQELKDACSSAFNSDDKYENAKRWCVVPYSVSQVLTSKSFKVLDVDSDEDEWDNLKGQYKENEIPGLVLRSTEDWQSLRTKCKELVEKKPWSDGYEDSISHATRWCTHAFVNNSDS
ncbi:hypothetical protein HF1_09680 [Mycoplasma haemofelis str. Langford 1]|uniref:Uncharacterized protein n=1 Tax=Mycoplasma haemofelis (strain Langford 1) TaxID=941640 RepID=E8ZIK5_MYCHL|nr:hypothetical protein [Mycoplasma haemofelis]CBY92976.1 hypothetical protein HF1_09680 [Mycoplasma haemofelis str. Langford 1]